MQAGNPSKPTATDGGLMACVPPHPKCADNLLAGAASRDSRPYGMSAYLRRVERLAVEALWGLAESEPIISQQHQLLAVHSPSIACPTANSLPYLNASTPLHPIILRQVENGHLSWRSGSPRSHFARRQGRHLYLRKCGRGSFPLPSRQWKPHDQDRQDNQRDCNNPQGRVRAFAAHTTAFSLHPVLKSVLPNQLIH